MTAFRKPVLEEETAAYLQAIPADKPFGISRRAWRWGLGLTALLWSGLFGIGWLLG